MFENRKRRSDTFVEYHVELKVQTLMKVLNGLSEKATGTFKPTLLLATTTKPSVYC